MMHGRLSFFQQSRERAGRPGLMLILAVSALSAQPVQLAAPRDPVLKLPPFKVEERFVVMLPPFMVEERGTTLKWNYYAAPGWEVLAACDPSLAAFVVRRTIQLDQMMAAFLPARFQAATAAPETLILMDESVGQSKAREVLADAMKRSEVGFMPNLRLKDLDMNAIFAAVSRSTWKPFVYAPDRMKALLEERVPRLPDWFIAGVEGFYRQIKFKDGEIEFGAASWDSKEEAEALRADPNRPRVLVPMAELLAPRKDRRTGADGAEAEWRAQAALFVRWAMLENSGAPKEALWRFLDRLDREPVSEALFRDCFGLGYADMRDELSDYLTNAVLESTQLRVVEAVSQDPLSLPEFRPATELEVARLRGDWERMEIAYVRQNSPEVVDKYVDQARKTLARAYDRGARDPRLFAAMGLTELDAGNPGDARLMLEAAVAGKVVRPRVYLELARLRYAAMARMTSPPAKLTAAQVAEVLGLLSEGIRQSPPLLENYLLFSEVVGRSVEPATAAQLAVLHAGALQYPQAAEFVVRVIYFHLVSNQPAAAAALAEAGLRATRDPAVRAKFERASASFRGTKPPANE